jgi:hypothetical protein
MRAEVRDGNPVYLTFHPVSSPYTVILVFLNIRPYICAGHGSQCCDVVLVKGCINLGKPQGVGICEWETDGEQKGRNGNEGISLRATWDQGGRILSQQGGFQVSKGVKKGKQKGNRQWEISNGRAPHVF